MKAFEGLLKELDEFSEKHKPEPVDVWQALPVNSDFIMQLYKLCIDNKVTVEMLQEEIQFNYKRIFTIKDYGSPQEKSDVDIVLLHPKYLAALIQILSANKRIPEYEIYFCNRLYISAIQSGNENLMKLYPYFYTLAKIVNYRMVKTLTSVLSENEAVMVAAARFYSSDIRTCIDNVSFILSNIKSKTLNLNDMKYIYETMINNDSTMMRHFFVYTMMNPYIQNNLTIITTIMSMVNDLPMNVISFLILEYIRECRRNRVPLQTYSNYTRVSIDNGSSVFPRVIQAYFGLVNSGCISSDGTLILNEKW